MSPSSDRRWVLSMTINWSRALSVVPLLCRIGLRFFYLKISIHWARLGTRYLLLSKMIKKTAAQFCYLLPTSPTLWWSKHQGATSVFTALSLQGPEAEEPRSRGTVHWSVGCWAALTAWVAQWETTDKRREGRVRCYFWNYHGKRCNEKLTAGLQRKKKEAAARKRKASLGSLQRSCRKIFENVWMSRNK